MQCTVGGLLKPHGDAASRQHNTGTAEVGGMRVDSFEMLLSVCKALLNDNFYDKIKLSFSGEGTGSNIHNRLKREILDARAKELLEETHYRKIVAILGMQTNDITGQEQEGQEYTAAAMSSVKKHLEGAKKLDEAINNTEVAEESPANADCDQSHASNDDPR